MEIIGLKIQLNHFNQFIYETNSEINSFIIIKTLRKQQSGCDRKNLYWPNRRKYRLEDIRSIQQKQIKDKSHIS